MALIQCPECGQTISDKAEKCPKCGYPIASNESETAKEPEAVSTEPTTGKKKDKKKLARIICIAAVMVAFAIGTFFAWNLLGTVTVKNIKIAKWKVTDKSAFGNYYEATVTADQKRPFIAVIGSYDKQNQMPYFAFIKNGEGKLSMYASDDDDPSVEYHPIGYCRAEEIKASSLSVKYKDRDYSDWSYSEYSSCNVDIELKLNGNRNGFLMVDIENVTNKENDCGIIIPIINGEGKYTYYANLPYKSRGIDIIVTPICYVKSTLLTENEYTVEKAFSVKKEVGKYSSYYDGEGVWSFPGFDDGLILYTMELIDGGDKAEREDVKYKKGFMHNHEIVITSHDYAKEGMLMPQYDINLIGYMPWTELAKE